MDHTLIQKFLAEIIGTFIFLGVIITVVNDKSSLMNSFKIGLALTIAIVFFGSVSGGNFNPAVSLAMTSAGGLPVTELFPYITAQMFGALVAHQLFIRFKI